MTLWVGGRSELEVLNNDVKEIYAIITVLRGGVADLSGLIAGPKSFRRVSTEQKIIKIYKDIIAVAKQPGVTLPR